MPDLWTHILCGHDILGQMKDDHLRSITESRIRLFNLGAQGPDIFYYYNFWTWIVKKEGEGLGKIMHTSRTGDFLITSLEYLKALKMQKDFEVLLPYILGLLCHYELDRIAHPYIYHYADVFSRNESKPLLYNSYHKDIEIVIDTILLEKKRKIKSYITPSYKEIDVGRALPPAIHDFYKKLLAKLYNIGVSGRFIDKSYKDMLRGLKILYDPASLKWRIASAAELFLKEEKKFTCAIYSPNINKERDYLNINHRKWNHPLNESETYYDSFYELYDRAVSEGKIIADAAADYINDRVDIAELVKILPNCSYLTGRLLDIKCNF